MIEEITSIDQNKYYQGVVGELIYGTLITGVKGHHDVIYIKVFKKKSEHTSLKFTPGYSVLLNIKTGSLRAIKGDSIVTVLKGKLQTELAVANRYKKRGLIS